MSNLRAAIDKIGLLALLLVFSAIHSAKADIVSFTESQGAGGTWQSGYQPLNLPQFDFSLGTLTSVSLTNWQEVVQATLTGTTTPSANGFQGIKLSEDNALAAVLNNAVVSSQNFTFTTPNWNLNGISSYQQVTVAQPYSQTWTGTLTLAPLSFTSAADLALFTGNGSVPLGGTLSSSTMIGTAGGNVNSKIVTNGSITATVSYSYTPSVAAVPETSTWVMGFLALGAVVFMIRRNASLAA